MSQRDSKGRFIKGVHYNIGHKHNLGRHHTEETKKKMSLSQLGHPNYLFKHSEESKDKNRLAYLDNKNGMWKGDDVGYFALHIWVRSRLPKPPLCQLCYRKPSEDLANVTGVYNRDFSNWLYLCRRCHKMIDK